MSLTIINQTLPSPASVEEEAVAIVACVLFCSSMFIRWSRVKEEERGGEGRGGGGGEEEEEEEGEEEDW